MQQNVMIVSIRLPLLFIIIGLCCASCAKQISPHNISAAVPGPRCIVYKTKADYTHLVPVMLSADKSMVVSYPDVKDIYNNGQLAYPTQLIGGYLLDNRGIGTDVAFLKVTYEEYSRLTVTPHPGELLEMILDKDPLAEMYDCGSRSQYQDPIAAMLLLIRSGELIHQKRLK